MAVGRQIRSGLGALCAPPIHAGSESGGIGSTGVAEKDRSLSTSQCLRSDAARTQAAYSRSYRQWRDKQEIVEVFLQAAMYGGRKGLQAFSAMQEVFAQQPAVPQKRPARPKRPRSPKKPASEMFVEPKLTQDPCASKMRASSHKSNTSFSLLLPAQQIITVLLLACSAGVSTLSRWSGTPEMTRVLASATYSLFARVGHVDPGITKHIQNAFASRHGKLAS